MTDPQAPAVTEAPEISIVSMVYRSRPYLAEFLAGCLEALREIECRRFEIVLVNDGSPDDSLHYLIERQTDIPQLVLVDLSRNFGHHAAAQAGLAHARGDLVFLIDCDLEVSPAVLPRFYQKLRASGCDVVYGYQNARRGGPLERIAGALFWKGLNLLSDTPIPENVVTERIMTRRFVVNLLQLGDRNLFFGGMMSWTGFDQIGMPVDKGRRRGPSTYTLMKRLGLLVNAVSSFSAKPLYLLFNVGIVITLASLAYAAYLVFRKIAFGDTLIGFTSLMGLMAMTLGVLTTGLGLLGIYLGKVYTQVQNRPTYIVRDIYRGGPRT